MYFSALEILHMIITCFLSVEGNRVLFKVLVLVEERTGGVVILAHVREDSVRVRHILPLSYNRAGY